MIDKITAPLFVPATRPERFEKACQSGTDAIIIDLEDAVAASEKQAARETLRRELPTLVSGSVLVGVRTNSTATEYFPDDAALLADLTEFVDYIVLPEVHGTNDLKFLQQRLNLSDDPLPVLALIESSTGLINAPSIAEFPTVRRLALGAADLSNEWEVEPSPSGAEFDHARQQLVISSRAAGLNGPLDTPHMNVRDTGGLAARMEPVMQLGMKGKLCIHPSQVDTVRQAFLVSPEEYSRLTELMRVFKEAESAGNASIQLEDGSFIDYPVYWRALKHVEAYEQFHRA